MSKFKEYLSLIPKGLKNPLKILEGIRHSVEMEFELLSEEDRKTIFERRVICEGCPFMSENAKTSEEFLALSGENYKSSRPDKHCTMCGCPIQYKTASLSSSCGIEAWNTDNPTRMMSLKWTNTKVEQDGKEESRGGQ